MKRGLLRGLFNDPTASNGTEDQLKFTRNRIQIVRKHIPALKWALSDYVSANANLMDRGDKIASILENYAKDENVTTGMKQQMCEFASILYALGGKRSSQMKALETKVLQEFPIYVRMCKNMEEELKSTIIARDREKIRVRQLRKAREDRMADRQQIFSAEAALVTATSESTRSSKSLQEQMDIFEKRRLTGLREILISWTVTELRFHAKAIELLTDAYNVAARIDADADIEEFRSKYLAANTSGVESNRGSSPGRCESLVQLLSIPSHRSSERFTGIGIPHPSASRVSFE